MNGKTKLLSENAENALTAYSAMSESKLAYFSQLQFIEEKYKDGGKATEDEEKILGDLLLAHDKQVSAFNQAMEQVTDPEDRMALIRHMQ